MGSTVRSLVVSAKVDAAGMAQGYAQAAAMTKEYQAEVGMINAQIAEAKKVQAAFDRDGDKVAAQMFAKKAQALRAERDQHVATVKAELQLDREYFVQTHSALEVQLADRQMHYAKLREMHQGNADVMMRISRTEAVELAKIQQQIDAEGGRGVLGNRAGRKAVKSLVAGTVANEISPELGSAVGMGTNVALMGGGAALATGVGAVALAASMASSAYKEAKEAAKNLLEIQKEYRDTVRDSAKWWAEQTRPQNTHVGEVLNQRNEDLAKQKSDLDKQLKDQDLAMHGFSRSVVAEGQHLTRRSGTSDDELARRKIQEMQDRNAVEQRNNEAVIAQQQHIQQLREASAIQAELEGAMIAAMVDGPEKKRLELLHAQEDVRQKMQQDHKDRLTLIYNDPTKTAAQVQSGTAEENASFAGKQFAQEQIFATQRQSLQARQGEDSHQEHVRTQEANLGLIRNNLTREMALLHLHQTEETRAYNLAGKNTFELRQRQAADEQAIVEKMNEDRHQETVQANAAEVNLIQDAYDREVKALALKQAEETRLYQQQGKDASELIRKQAAERQAIVESEREWVKAQLDSLDPLRQQAEYVKKINDAKKAGVLSAKDEQTLLHKNDKPIMDEIKRDQVQLAFMRGEISKAQEEFAQLKLSNPLASDDELKKLVAIRQEMEGMKSLQVGSFGKFSKHQVKIGSVNMDIHNGNKTLKAGQFGGFGHSDISGVNLNIPQHVLEAARGGKDGEMLGVLQEILFAIRRQQPLS